MSSIRFSTGRRITAFLALSALIVVLAGSTSALALTSRSPETPYRPPRT